MKRDVRKFEIGWRLYSLIIGCLILLFVAGFSFAYGGSSPSNMGHSAGELEIPNVDLSNVCMKNGTNCPALNSCSWESISLSDTSNFDLNCDYRMKVTTADGVMGVYTSVFVLNSEVIFETSSGASVVSCVFSNAKGKHRLCIDGDYDRLYNSFNEPVISLEKLCC